MAIPKPKDNIKYSYADYLSWPDEERWELIDGVAYDMSPAPGSVHQIVSGELFSLIHTFLKGKKCRVLAAPFDVRLQNEELSDEDNFTVVQPDIVVICDPRKIDERGCKGAPDICIEILSPSTSYKDQTEKLKLYEARGVREYWLVNPGNETFVIYSARAEGSQYGKPDYYTKDETVETPVLPGLKIVLSEVFAAAEYNQGISKN